MTPKFAITAITDHMSQGSYSGLVSVILSSGGIDMSAYMAVSQNEGPRFGSPYNKDINIYGGLY